MGKTALTHKRTDNMRGFVLLVLAICPLKSLHRDLQSRMGVSFDKGRNKRNKRLRPPARPVSGSLCASADITCVQREHQLERVGGAGRRGKGEAATPDTDGRDPDSTVQVAPALHFPPLRLRPRPRPRRASYLQLTAAGRRAP